MRVVGVEKQSESEIMAEVQSNMRVFKFLVSFLLNQSRVFMFRYLDSCRGSLKNGITNCGWNIFSESHLNANPEFILQGAFLDST